MSEPENSKPKLPGGIVTALPKPAGQPVKKIPAATPIAAPKPAASAVQTIFAATPFPAIEPAVQPVKETVAATPSLAAEPLPYAVEKIVSAPALPQPVAKPLQAVGEELFAAYRTTLTSVGESQRAVASGIKALTLEVTGLAEASATEVGDSAAALSRARNFAEIVEIQLGYARRSFAAMIAGSTRLSEIGATLMSEASRPIVAPFTERPHD